MPDGWVVRDATLDDVDVAVEALEWLFEPPGSRPTDWDRSLARARLTHLLSSPDCTVLLAVDTKLGVIGIATCYVDIVSVRFGQRASIEDLAVRDDVRSSGVGAELLRACQEWAVNMGAAYLFLESGTGRTDAHRFYARHGGHAHAASFRWAL